MQTITIQRIYQFSREQYLYLISFALLAYWCYEAVDWYFYSLKRFGTGSILNDEITQLYLLYAVTPAVYAWYRSAHVQEHRVLRFALKSYLGLMLTMSVLFGTYVRSLLSHSVTSFFTHRSVEVGVGAATQSANTSTTYSATVTLRVAQVIKSDVLKP